MAVAAGTAGVSPACSVIRGEGHPHALIHCDAGRRDACGIPAKKPGRDARGPGAGFPQLNALTVRTHLRKVRNDENRGQSDK